MRASKGFHLWQTPCVEAQHLNSLRQTSRRPTGVRPEETKVDMIVQGKPVKLNILRYSPRSDVEPSVQKVAMPHAEQGLRSAPFSSHANTTSGATSLSRTNMRPPCGPLGSRYSTSTSETCSSSGNLRHLRKLREGGRNRKAREGRGHQGHNRHAHVRPEAQDET